MCGARACSRRNGRFRDVQPSERARMVIKCVLLPPPPPPTRADCDVIRSRNICIICTSRYCDTRKKKINKKTVRSVEIELSGPVVRVKSRRSPFVRVRGRSLRSTSRNRSKSKNVKSKINNEWTKRKLIEKKHVENSARYADWGEKRIWISRRKT